MGRILTTSMLLLLICVGKCETCFADQHSSMHTVSRAAIDRKYTFIDKHLKPIQKHKLSNVTAGFNDLLQSTVIQSKDVNIYGMAKEEAKKLFGICSPEQLDAIVFHMLITLLNEIEPKVDNLNQKYGHTSAVYNGLNLKAFLLFETSAKLYPTLKKISAKTIEKIY